MTFRSHGIPAQNLSKFPLHRGYPHVHIMMWTDELSPSAGSGVHAANHDFGPSDNESIPDTRPPSTTEQLYDKYVCTRSPRRWREIYQNDEMASLAELLVHKHSPYCGKYSLGACRFGFPHSTEPRTRAKEARETLISRSKNTYLVRRRSDAAMMGLYNTDILRKWRGSMDLQAISDANNAHKYIMGYNFKMEDDNVTHRRVEELIARLSARAGDIDAQDVYRVAHAALQGRSTSTFEAAHLLLGEPVVQFSRDNVWIQTARPEAWTVAVPHQEITEAIANPSEYALSHTRMPSLLKHYANWRANPPSGGDHIELPVDTRDTKTAVLWANLTLFDFAAGVRIYNEGGTTLFRPRNKPAIVGHRNYNPDTEPEDFYFAKLLLHTPWMTPGDWLLAQDQGLHAKAFHRLVQDDATFLCSACYPNFNATLTVARELFKVQADMYLRGQLEGNEAQSHYEDTMKIVEQLRAKCGSAMEMDVPDNIDTGAMNIAFGAVPGGDEAFRVLTSPENKDDPIISRQRKVMELIIANVLYPKEHSTKLRLILHGPGGCGKSFVLRAAASKIRESQRCGGAIIAAYTGAAAYQAGGVTLHSCLGLPVVNRSYGHHESDVPMPQGARLQNLKDIWRHVSVLFIDEMSLISSKLLKRIDLHLRHIKPQGAHAPFGGINIIMIGDFYQLPPVGDHPMFHDMSTFKLFRLCELEGNHRAARDPRWAALLGRVRKGLHTEDDITLLRSRVKKTISPDAVRLCATRQGVLNANNDQLECHLGRLASHDVYTCPAQDMYESNALEPSPAENAYPAAEVSRQSANEDAPQPSPCSVSPFRCAVAREPEARFTSAPSIVP